MRPEESFVGANVRALQTMLRVISRHDSKIPTVVPDGIYGQDTLNAVSAFQRIHGLPVTGVVDLATWEAIAEEYDQAIIYLGKPEPIQILLEPEQIIRLGEYNANLYLLQAMLAFLSTAEAAIPRPEVSGTLDSGTAAALRVFQNLADLPETGELDRVTWKQLVLQYTLNANRENRKGPPREFYF